SNFEYSDLKLEKNKIAIGNSLNLSLTLKNSGASDSAEVVQFYLSDVQASSIVPLHHLVGFERVELKAGESRTIKFSITPEMMSFINDDGKLTLEPGEFRLEVGGCSPGKRGQELGASKPVIATFEVQ
ncbi:MAG TPA: glycosyl hydrolase, partial [Anaerolineae bacterium]|nr:glycosyl hydrolase [Anaerolineae bacterium]